MGGLEGRAGVQLALSKTLQKGFRLSEPQFPKRHEGFCCQLLESSGAHELWGVGIGGLYVVELLGLKWELGLVWVDSSRRGRMPGQHPGTDFVGGSYGCT